mgnify:CR=1 FL=1
MNLETSLAKTTKEDLEVFIELEKSVAGSKVYSPMLDREEALREIEGNDVRFIKIGEEIAGSVMLESKNPNHTYISGLVVPPRFQGMGVGKKVMEIVLKELAGKERVDLVVHPENEKAVSLYKSLGFYIESRQENYYGDGEPRLIMVYSGKTPISDLPKN